MSDAESPYLSVVVPAYNEEGRLPATLRRMQEFLDSRGMSYEIVLVNDGSTDNTVLLAEKMAAVNGHLRILSHEPNRGKGFAVRRGMLAAKGRFVFYSDADLSTPIEELEKLLSHLEEGVDVVVGSRGMETSELEIRQPWYRETMGRIFNRLVRDIALPGISVADTQCGFKGFRRECVEDIFTRQTLERFAFDVEILCIAHHLGYRMKEIPIRWLNSPESRVHIVRDSSRMMWDVFRIRLRALKGNYN